MAKTKWPPQIPGTSLSTHLERLNNLVDRALDDGRESAWYLVYNFALTFIATRTESEDEPTYVWPQGSLYAFKPEESQEGPDFTDRQTRSMLDLTQRRISDLVLRDELDAEAPDADISLRSDLPGPEKSLQETSETPVNPRMRFRTPDFLVVLQPEDQDILCLGVEVKPAVEIGRWSERGTDSQYLTKFNAIFQQTFEQAQMAFRRYPNQDVVHVMVAVGLWVRFLIYERYSTPSLEDEDAVSAVSKPYSSIPMTKTRVFNLLDNEDRRNAKDYNVLFKRYWTKAKSVELTSPNDDSEESSGSGNPSDSGH